MFLCLLSVGRASEKHLWGRRGVIVYIFYCLVILCVYDDKTLCVYVCGSVGGWMISCHALCVRACTRMLTRHAGEDTGYGPAACRIATVHHGSTPALHLPSSAAGHLSFLSPRVESSTNTPCANRRQPCSGPERGRKKMSCPSHPFPRLSLLSSLPFLASPISLQIFNYNKSTKTELIGLESSSPRPHSLRPLPIPGEDGWWWWGSGGQAHVPVGH